MGREFDVVVERDGEGFYVAPVPALPGCHTQARSLDELMERIKEATTGLNVERDSAITSFDPNHLAANLRAFIRGFYTSRRRIMAR